MMLADVPVKHKRRVVMSEPFLGEIRMFGGNFAPRSWALCNGQLLPISQNDALYSILGTTYGGDGRSTFGLPDLQGRSPKHPGDGAGLNPVRLGQKGGREAHNLTTAEMPSHNHTGTMHAETAIGDATNPQGRLLAVSGSNDLIYSSSAPIQNLTLHSDALVIQNTGGGQSFSIESPYLGVNFIIALQGAYPPRS